MLFITTLKNNKTYSKISGFKNLKFFVIEGAQAFALKEREMFEKTFEKQIARTNTSVYGKSLIEEKLKSQEITEDSVAILQEEAKHNLAQLVAFVDSCAKEKSSGSLDFQEAAKRLQETFFWILKGLGE